MSLTLQLLEPEGDALDALLLLEAPAGMVVWTPSSASRSAASCSRVGGSIGAPGSAVRTATVSGPLKPSPKPSATTS